MVYISEGFFMRIKKPGAEKFTSGSDQLSYRLDGNVLYLSGSLRLAEAGPFTNNLLRLLKNRQVGELTINLDQLNDIDSSGVIALHFVKNKQAEKGVLVKFSGGPEAIHEKLEIFKPEKASEDTSVRHRGAIERVGGQVHFFFTSFVYGFLLLAANVFYWAVADLFRPKARPEGSFVSQSIHIGVNAVLIVLFMSFIIGLVMSMHSSGHLRTFGANIFVVDLVVIAVMSQMGPLITGILVAGRSGSSIAAEIATMRVTAELDSLTTMGLDPIRFVVVPKLYAALFAMPFLIIIANVAGIFGGGLAAYLYLDITPEMFINRMGSVMQGKDLLTGFVKSQVYASIIVLTGSFYGFRVEKGAEGVGKVTTVAVVVAISLVILADSLLGLLFY
jgi:phospholipid/cholesterol/gamma-HCH transport system permease protein